MVSSVITTRKAAERAPSTPDESYRNPQAERLLAELGLDWELQRIPITQIDRTASLANQARFEPVQEALVERYTTALSQGAVFPPIIVGIVNGKYVVADGNHRFLANEAADRDSILVYSFTISRDDFTTLSALANTRLNGAENTMSERLAHANDAVNRGANSVDAAIQFGVTPNALATYRKAEATRLRLTALGMSVSSYAGLSDHALSKITTGMTDEAVRLAIDALNKGISPQRVFDAISGTQKVQPYSARVELQTAQLQELFTSASNAGKLKGRPKKGASGTRLMRLQGALTVINEALSETNLPANQAAVLAQIRAVVGGS